MNENNPGVILIHGFLDAGEIWRPVMNILGNLTDQWISFDLPGMGRHSADAGPFTLGRYTDVVVDCIDKMQGPVVLIGHSMGAQIAELSAMQRPGQVKGMVLLSPIPLAGAHAPEELTTYLAGLGGDANAQRDARRSLMATPVDANVLEKLVTIGENVRLDTTRKLVAAWDKGAASGVRPSAFTGPVLIATGMDDTFATFSNAQAIASRFSRAQVLTIPSSGHWPHVEQPDFVADLIENFVLSLGHRSAAGSKHTGATGWTRAFGEKKEDAFGAAFADNVRFEASVMKEIVEGRERVKTVLGAASKLYESLEFTRRAVDGDRTYLEWDAKLAGGERVAGVTILTADPDGTITGIAIHHRPLSGLLRFSSDLAQSLNGRIESSLFHSTT
jgi:pimeloyl-ACP methyl ester carboxylesterase